MKKPCEICKHQELTTRDEPCRNCVNLEGYEPVERDEKQLWLELTAMYITALSNDEGIDEWHYEVMKDRFMNKLSEFKTAIIREQREECW